MLQVRRGAADDFELILAMIDEAATWLRDKQTDQWAQPWPSRRPGTNGSAGAFATGGHG